MIQDTIALDQQLGQSMNVTKSIAFVIGTPAQKRAIKETTFEGNRIALEGDAKSLGAHIIARRQKRCRFGDQRAQAALSTLSRLENLGCPWQARIPMAAAAAIQKCTYGSVVARPTKKMVLKVRTAAIRATWGTSRAMRAPEMVLTAITPVHRVDPVSALDYHFFKYPT